jgi:hypothetical protein
MHTWPHNGTGMSRPLVGSAGRPAAVVCMKPGMSMRAYVSDEWIKSSGHSEPFSNTETFS